MAVLYLKPAYAIPNLFGNVAFNLMHQGFAAPATSSTRPGSTRLGRRLTARVDAVMGEGIARSLDTGQGLGRQAVHGAAEAWASSSTASRAGPRSSTKRTCAATGRGPTSKSCSTTRRSRTKPSRSPG